MSLGLENEATEFKESLAEREEAMKDIGAILNKRGKGTIYFGVRNDGEIVGLNIGAYTESDLANKINSSIEPAPFYSIETKTDSLNRKFIEVDFYGDAKPYRAKGTYYLRNGERSDLMPTSILSEMLIQAQKTYDDWENASSELEMDGIDEKLLKDVIDTGNKLNRMNYRYENAEGALRYLHLINAEGSINKAGEALFSKERPFICRLSTLGDIDGTVFLDMQRASGNIFELIDLAYEYVLSKLDYRPFFVSGEVQRTMVPEIPSEAIRELLVNAFGHAFYAAPFSQDVAIYPNRVSIYNPGPFPSVGKPEDFASKLLKPMDKNDRINNVLYFRNYIEHFGTGFTKVFELFKQKRITYYYQNFNGGFLFEIFRPGKVMIDESLNDYQKVLAVIKQDAYASFDQIANYVGKSKSTINRLIAALKEQGRIERSKDKGDEKWKIT